MQNVAHRTKIKQLYSCVALAVEPCDFWETLNSAWEMTAAFGSCVFDLTKTAETVLLLL